MLERALSLSPNDHQGVRFCWYDAWRGRPWVEAAGSRGVGTDLRCIDAHAHLGNLVFDRQPERALVHYEIGMKIAELSLPPGFDGVLIWGHIYNRPFLRCLRGYGLCLWRLGRLDEAEQVFARILSLNPNDNQGVRACWHDVRHSRPWTEEAA